MFKPQILFQCETEML